MCRHKRHNTPQLSRRSGMPAFCFRVFNKSFGVKMEEKKVKYREDEIVFDYTTGKKLFGGHIQYDDALLDKIAEIIYTDIIKDFSQEKIKIE